MIIINFIFVCFWFSFLLPRCCTYPSCFSCPRRSPAGHFCVCLFVFLPACLPPAFFCRPRTRSATFHSKTFVWDLPILLPSRLSCRAVDLSSISRLKTISLQHLLLDHGFSLLSKSILSLHTLPRFHFILSLIQTESPGDTVCSLRVPCNSTRLLCCTTLTKRATVYQPKRGL